MMSPRISVPSGVTKLLIDQGARRCFVEVDLARGDFGSLNELEDFGRRRMFGSRLERRQSGRNLRLLVFDVLRELFPNRPLFGFPSQPLLNGLSCASMLLGFALGSGGSVFAFGKSASQGRNLFPERHRGIDWLRGRDERAERNVGLLAVGPVKPDSELAGELECRQRVGLGSGNVVGRAVSPFSIGVEYVGRLFGDDPFEGQATERLFESLPLITIGRMMAPMSLDISSANCRSLKIDVVGSLRK
jgi:hypothetical protein